MVTAGLVIVTILTAFIGYKFVSGAGSFLDKGGITFEEEEKSEIKKIC